MTASVGVGDALRRTILLCACVIELCMLVRAFNVDTENCVRHRGPPGSMFGFSVAEHRERGGSWLLVGAPEAQTAQPDVTRGGAVFRCDINKDDSCQEIPFDVAGNNNNSAGAQIDKKSYQWFGASLASSGENGVVVACAPRYIWYSINYKKREPVGTCWVSKNIKDFADFSEYSPCRLGRNWGYNKQGSCQAGLGASISKDGKRLFIGAPGSFFWQGQLFSIDSNEPIYFPPYYTRLMDLEPGQVISQNLYDRPELKATRESPPSDDDSYMGYSVAAGTFSGESGVAVGMPRGAKLLGKVVLYTTNLTNLQNITGEQLGAYFAYAVTTSDVDGDGTDDLIIGAPLFTDPKNNLGHYEMGRIYVVYQGKETYKFRQSHTRDGKNSKARFGLSLCNLGDINKDGYGDFAVGAPYDGPNERGVVYIYHGSPIGVRENPSQIITAEDVNYGFQAGSLTTFGFSLAGGLDLDQNQYPDLVIGAYESDTAFFLRSRPVVKVKSTLSFSSESKQIILEEKNCTLKDASKVTCMTLTACLEYNGVGVDPQTALHSPLQGKTELNVQILLDSKKPKSPRMFFLSDEGKNVINQTLLLIKGTQFCKSMFIYVKPNLRDKLTSLEAEMRYSLLEQKASGRRRLSHTLSPILDMDDELGLVSRDSVSIQKNCGKDNVCIPNLKLTSVPSVNRYILGSGDRMEVDVLVENEGEDSFETSYEMGVPLGLNYVNIERYDEGDRDIPILCSAPSYANNNTLHCDIGNPLPSKRLVHFKVLLQPSFQETLKPRYEFWMAVNSTNPEVAATVSDNIKELTVPIWVETDLVVEGSSHPTDLHYNSSLYTTETITEEGQAGPQLVHIYNIRNKGPSDIMAAEAYFLWPSYTVDGDHLLYLLEQPETSGAIQCEVIDTVNEKNLKLDRKKSYLETAGVAGFQSGLSSAHTVSEYSDGKDGFSYAQEKTFQQSSSSSSSSASGSYGKGSNQKVSVQGGGRRVDSSKSYESGDGAGGAYSGGSQGRQASSGGVVYGGVTNVQQNAEGKIAFETSVADLVAASNQGHSARNDTNEAARTNVIEDHVIQYGTVGKGGGYSSLNLGTGYSGSDKSSSGYAGSDRSSKSYSASADRTTDYSAAERGSTGYSASADRAYSGGDRSNTGYSATGSSDRTNTGYSATGSIDRSNTGYSATGSRFGGNSMSSEANAAWAQGGGRSGVNVDVNLGGLKNASTFRSSEKSHSSNTTWDSNSGPITSASDSWRTNDNGLVRNGSSSSVYGAGGSSYGSGGRQYSSVSSSGGRGESSRRVSETEEEYRTRTESVKRVYPGSSGRDMPSEYSEENYSSSRDTDSYTAPELAAREQERDRLYQEELRKYYENLRRLEAEDEIKKRKEEETRRIEHERYVEEQRRLREYETSSSSSSDERYRYRRDVDSSDEALEKALKCGPTKCIRVKCNVGALQKDQEAWVAFRSRVWIPTIKKIASNKEVSLSSLLVARVTKIPHIGTPDQATIKTHEIFTKVIPRETGVPPGMVPLWVVVLSAVAGAIILMLLVYLLYKWGFFKRRRPTDVPEKEPLNRNGYQHSDD
uniref:Integrin alpha-PS2 n=1 Tax=Cacopsylla melanoneura TaxID=428564 RepID=A0A8D8XF03_9HEMI